MPRYDINKQNEAIARLRAELEKINQNFDEVMKKAGIRDPKELEVEASSVTGELKAAMDKKRESVMQESRNAVAALREETEIADPSHRPSMGRRRGMLSI